MKPPVLWDISLRRYSYSTWGWQSVGMLRLVRLGRWAVTFARFHEVAL